MISAARLFGSLALLLWWMGWAPEVVLGVEPQAFEYNKRAEIKASDFCPAALDVNTGILYFTVEGTNLYYKPNAESTAAGVAAVVGLLAELRHARSVVFTYFDQAIYPPAHYPGELYFPAYAPLKEGAMYRPAGAFYLQY